MSDFQQWGQPPSGQPISPGYAPGSAPGPAMPDEKERQWGMLAHISPLLVGFMGPLLLMLVDPTGQPSAFVKHNAKQAMIWHVAMIVVAMLTCGVGGVIMLIWHVLGALEANKGVWYVYPACQSFVDQPPPPPTAG